eukprot:scaffold49240_cov17-Tisochrysis_lutea.AAC.4
MRPRELSGVLWAAASSGHALGPVLLDTLMEAGVFSAEMQSWRNVDFLLLASLLGKNAYPLRCRIPHDIVCSCRGVHLVETRCTFLATLSLKVCCVDRASVLLAMLFDVSGAEKSVCADSAAVGKLFALAGSAC